MEPLHGESEQQNGIKLAAYYLWQERGCPFGSPEVDWFRAEEQLHGQSAEGATEPAMVAVAKAMGAALGSVAGLVASRLSDAE